MKDKNNKRKKIEKWKKERIGLKKKKQTNK